MSNKKSFRPRPNFLWSIVSVASVLFLFGIFGLITMHSDSLLKSLKEEFEIVIEVNPKATDQQIAKLKEQLQKEAGVLAGSIKFTSKEEGLKLLSQDLGDELLEIDMPNPLTDVISFRMDGSSFDLATLEHIKDKYNRGHPEVLSIYYQEGMIESIVSNLDSVSYIFLIAGILLSVLAFMLIYNSIRLSIYANRFLIRNMELVGASWSFIRRPFLRKSLIHGVLSAITAIVGLAVAYYATSTRLPEIVQYLQEEYILYLIGTIVLAGVVINLGSTWVVVTRFLDMNAGDLHH